MAKLTDEKNLGPEPQPGRKLHANQNSPHIIQHVIQHEKSWDLHLVFP